MEEVQYIVSGLIFGTGALLSKSIVQVDEAGGAAEEEAGSEDTGLAASSGILVVETDTTRPARSSFRVSRGARRQGGIQFSTAGAASPGSPPPQQEGEEEGEEREEGEGGENEQGDSK